MAVSKKSTTSTKAAPKKTTAKVEHPSYLEMVKECIVANKDNESSVSRNTIKKFLASQYKLDMSSKQNTGNLSRAIDSGTEKGIFVLPKGISGKVGLNKSSGKENVAPPKVTTAAPKVSHKKGAAAASKTTDKAPAKKPLQPTGGSKSRPAKPVAAPKAAPVKTPGGSKSRPAKPAAPAKAAPVAAKKAAPVSKKAAPAKAAPVAKKAAAKTKSTVTKTKTKTSAKAEAAAAPPKPKRGAPKQRS